ncbi:hypothetical protein PPL_02784 [Heterostelium album PN500]|uniref:Uncharacterized protein n=1 Tax=Heterostelium pallidum (strain ATCC 26659 / Pp 5 / PN500) TaxID=670386 RepID=D3B319_HETP5|nr:hypothetical protein PPL_02784 [Heterostelium album PN500]EFA83717.1 hypothetical protein PPL_02784 [Heterostelium album PN500]|eukprot:XP_020435834.1 hypothetical protein PPL_02784 [Heterostelium album PN500]
MEDLINSFKRHLIVKNDLKGKISRFSLRFKDSKIESQFDQHTNKIHVLNNRVLISLILTFEIIWTVSNFLTNSGVIVARDIGNWIELFNTTCAFLLTWLWTSTNHLTIAFFLPLVFCTNNLPKVTGYDDVTYDPVSQILLWLMFAVPGIKFWRSTIISFTSIAALVVVRLVQNNYGVTRIIFIEGASYLVYTISILTASRSIELIERELYLNIRKELDIINSNQMLQTGTIEVERIETIEENQRVVDVNIVLSKKEKKEIKKLKKKEKQLKKPLKTSRIYMNYIKDLKSQTKRFRWEFTDAQKERAFVEYYRHHVNVEYLAILTIIFSSTYYLIQDLQISESNIRYLFIALRFAGMVPFTFVLMYLSFLRKTRPHLADIISTIFIIMLIGIYTAMFVKSPAYQTSLFYFGGVMRTLSFSATQCLLVPFAVQMLAQIPILPIGYYLFGDPIVGQILMCVSFMAITYSWTFNKEKVFRISFLQRIQLNKLEFMGTNTIDIQQQSRRSSDGSEKNSISTPTVPPTETEIIENKQLEVEIIEK